jgi:hypothetical protein
VKYLTCALTALLLVTFADYGYAKDAVTIELDPLTVTRERDGITHTYTPCVRSGGPVGVAPPSNIARLAREFGPGGTLMSNDGGTAVMYQEAGLIFLEVEVGYLVSEWLFLPIVVAPGHTNLGLPIAYSGSLPAWLRLPMTRAELVDEALSRGGSIESDGTTVTVNLPTTKQTSEAVHAFIDDRRVVAAILFTCSW